MTEVPPPKKVSLPGTVGGRRSYLRSCPDVHLQFAHEPVVGTETPGCPARWPGGAVVVHVLSTSTLDYDFSPASTEHTVLKTLTLCPVERSPWCSSSCACAGGFRGRGWVPECRDSTRLPSGPRPLRTSAGVVGPLPTHRKVVLRKVALIEGAQETELL